MAKTKTLHALSDEAILLVAARFRVLGEPSRLRILQYLRNGELNVSQLVEATGLTQANTSRHLQALAEAAILGRRREGPSVFYFIADPGIFDLCETVCGSLQRQFQNHARAFSPTARAPKG
jgi:DNA-binding transcriptional ArsR family regulator